MAHKHLLAATVALATLALAGTAGASTVIDFNSGSGSVASYVQSGVTFTTTIPGAFEFQVTPNGTNGLLPDGSPRPTLRADIAGGASSVSVDLGDYNSDADLLFLDIYNASNVLLGHTDLLINTDFTGMKTLSLSAAGIAYALFGSTVPSINGSSVYADNFTFDATPSGGVPEPAAWTLMLAGFFGLGAALRRTRPTYA